MNMDINKKYTLPRAIILAVCPLLLAVACDNYDGPGPDTPAEEVPLNFNASIEKTGTTQSRTIITPTTDFTGNSYSFGMSLTKSENGSEIFKGSSDMTATMERPNSSTQWNWYFTDNSDNATVTPAGPEGKALKVVAYYPPVLSATKDVYTDGIPFDFSSKTDLKQTDLLYNTSTIYPFVPSGDPVATIPLNFRHAYTWIVLNITKYVDKGPEFTLSSVSLDNLGGSWIKNQGAIDPETGLNLASSSSAVLETYGSMTEAGLRLNQLNRNASIFHPAAVTTMQLIDYAVEDASFLRINNITVGYTLPKTWVKKAFLQNVRIYLTGYNLFCWTNYTGADPEVDTSSKRNALTPGVDYAAYPKSRSFVGGINITF